MLLNGLSVLGSRWGGQPARFALSRLRLFLFEARRSGYFVREGEVKGPGFLVLAFSTRTLKSSGFRHDECRPEASAWACCLWLAALPHGRRAFRAVHRFCWGHALLSARIPLFVKLLSLCWLAALRGVACFALALQVAVVFV